MMRLAANTLKELRLGWRSYYFLLVVGVAIAYFLLVTFLSPEDLPVSPDVVVLTAMEAGAPPFSQSGTDTQLWCALIRCIDDESRSPVFR